MQEPVQWGGGWWRQGADGAWWYWNAVAFQWEPYGVALTKPSGPRAGFWTRFGASFVDGMILFPVMLAILWPLVGDDLSKALKTNDPVEMSAAFERIGPTLNVVSLVVTFGYRVTLEGGRRGVELGPDDAILVLAEEDG